MGDRLTPEREAQIRSWHAKVGYADELLAELDALRAERGEFLFCMNMLKESVERMPHLVAKAEREGFEHACEAMANAVSPFSGLDGVTIVKVRDIIYRLREQYAKTPR